MKLSGQYDDKISLKENIKSLWLKFMYFGINNPIYVSIHTNIPQFSLYNFTNTRTDRKQIDDMLEVYKMGIEKQEIKLISYELALGLFLGKYCLYCKSFREVP